MHKILNTPYGSLWMQITCIQVLVQGLAELIFRVKLVKQQILLALSHNLILLGSGTDCSVASCKMAIQLLLFYVCEYIVFTHNEIYAI